MPNERLLISAILLVLCWGAGSLSSAEEPLEMESVAVKDRLKAFEDLVITAKKTADVTGRKGDAVSDEVAALLEEARKAEEAE